MLQERKVNERQLALQIKWMLLMLETCSLLNDEDFNRYMEKFYTSWMLGLKWALIFHFV